MPAAESVRATLERGQRRLALRVGLRRAGWFLLAAVLTAELALGFGQTWILLATAALSVAAVACLLRPPTPRLALTAAVLDATLEQGATISAAAEALDGQHSRFASRLLADAEAALATTPLARLLPLRLPTGLILGGAAALLLPLLLPQARANQRDLTSLPEPPSLLAPDVLGGGSGAGSTPTPEGPTTPSKRLQVTAATDATPTVDRDPLAHLPLDVRAALEKRLQELSADLPASNNSTGSGAQPAKPGETPADTLTQALRDADAPTALAELDRLAAQAKQGNAAAAARLTELSERAGAAGAGAATANPQPVSDGGDDDDDDPARATRAGDRTPLPWALNQTVDRYFAPR